MSKELDTSWFDLKKYKELKSAPINKWARLLEERNRCEWIASLMKIDNSFPDDSLLGGNYPEHHSEALNCLKQGAPLFKDDLLSDMLDFKGFQSSVYDLSLGDAWRIARDSQLLHVDEWEEDEYAEINQQPVGVEEFLRIATVNINLCATDEQIKKDFNVWLRDLREETGIKPQTKLFTQTDFDNWVEYGAIPYLDLMLVAKLEGKKITQNKMARLIFPNEYGVDIVERLRKVTKPLAKSLISYDTFGALNAQFESENAAGMKNA